MGSYSIYFLCLNEHYVCEIHPYFFTELLFVNSYWSILNVLQFLGQPCKVKNGLPPKIPVVLPWEMLGRPCRSAPPKWPGQSGLCKWYCFPRSTPRTGPKRKKRCCRQRGVSTTHPFLGVGWQPTEKRETRGGLAVSHQARVVACPLLINPCLLLFCLPVLPE